MATVAFDKTGTLTRGQFQVVQLAPQAPVTATELLQMAASVEQNSTHPIAVSIVTAYAGEPFPVQDVREQAGHGLTANVAGKKVVVGNTKALQQAGVTVAPTTNPGTVIYVAVAGQYWGHLIIADEAKPDAALAIAKLKQRGIRQTVMLTGDNRTVGEAMAQQLKLDTVRSELLPADKVNVVQQLLQKAHARHKKVAFVGDGINDTPVLVTADVGIAMGGLGADAAVEAADMVIMGDEPAKVATAIQIAKRTRQIVMENITFALIVKVGFLLIGALGLVNMWQAVFADVGVTILAVLNAIRLQLIRFK